MTVPEILNNQEIIKALSTTFDFDDLIGELDKQGLDISNNEPEQYYILANTGKVQAIKKKYQYPHSQPIITTKLWNLYMVPPSHKDPNITGFQGYTQTQELQYFHEDLELNNKDLIPYEGYNDNWEEYL